MDESEFLGQVNADLDDQLKDEGVDTEIIKDAIVDDNEPDELKLSPIEQKAYDQGWRPQKDFTGDEDSWKTAREYVQYGEIISLVKQNKKELDNQKRDFDDRLENTNKLNEARRKSEIADLKTKQREAVDLADTDAYDSTQKKIDELESQTVTTQPAQQGKDPDIVDWEAKNPWINDVNDERTVVAQSMFNNYTAQNKGASAAQALAHIDSKLSKLYPTENTNARRDQPNTTESVARKPQRRSKELSMSDLTNEESKEWQMFGRTMFKTEKAFLKAVKDARVK